MVSNIPAMEAAFSNAQLSFSNSNSRLPSPAFHSGCPVSVVDWNNDGLDDIIRLDNAEQCYVDVQKSNQQFERVYLGSISNNAWAMAVADFDKNGYKDVVAGGSGFNITIFKTNNTGTGATKTTIANSGFFLQNLTMADINNDGWVDIFACDDNAASHIYLNDGAGNFTTQSNILIIS